MPDPKIVRNRQGKIVEFEAAPAEATRNGIPRTAASEAVTEPIFASFAEVMAEKWRRLREIQDGQAAAMAQARLQVAKALGASTAVRDRAVSESRGELDQTLSLLGTEEPKAIALATRNVKKEFGLKRAEAEAKHADTRAAAYREYSPHRQKAEEELEELSQRLAKEMVVAEDDLRQWEEAACARVRELEKAEALAKATSEPPPPAGPAPATP